MYIKRRRTREAAGAKRDISKSKLIKIIIAAAVVVIAIVAGVNYISGRNVSKSYLARRETIDAGIRTDVAGFASLNASGEVEGFDRDVLNEILARALGEEKPINYIPLQTEDSCSSMKYGITDLGIGFLVDGSERIKGFTVTKPYYYDDVYALVRPEVSSTDALNGKTVGILNSMITLDTADKYFKKAKIEPTVARYYDYETAGKDLESGKIVALLVPEGLIAQYFDGAARLPAPLFQIGYSIVLPSGQSAVQGAINSAISSMRSDGTIEALAQKWGLPYSGGK